LRGEIIILLLHLNKPTLRSRKGTETGPVEVRGGFMKGDLAVSNCKNRTPQSEKANTEERESEIE